MANHESAIAKMEVMAWKLQIHQWLYPLDIEEMSVEGGKYVSISHKYENICIFSVLFLYQ